VVAVEPSDYCILKARGDRVVRGVDAEAIVGPAGRCDAPKHVGVS
jgi:hypothetical protein